MPTPRHPMPERRWRHNEGKPTEGAWHFPWTRHMPDPQMDAILGSASGYPFERRYIEFVAGRKGDGTWSRGPDSYHTLDRTSSGLTHTHIGSNPTMPEDLADFANRNPSNLALLAWGFGEDVAQNLTDEDWLPTVVTRRKGFDRKDLWQAAWDFLPAGMYEISRHPSYIRAQVIEALKKPKAGLEEAQRRGWDSEFAAAALGRYANSRGAGGMRTDVRNALKLLPSNVSERDALHFLYHDFQWIDEKDGGRGKSSDYHSRWVTLTNTFSLNREAPARLSADVFDYSAGDIVRQDGTVPRFAALGLAGKDPRTWPAPPAPNEAGIPFQSGAGERSGERGSGAGGFFKVAAAVVVVVGGFYIGRKVFSKRSSETASKQFFQPPRRASARTTRRRINGT